jgi:hypothetical protein
MAGREDNPALGLLCSFGDLDSERCSQSRMPDMDYVNVIVIDL